MTERFVTGGYKIYDTYKEEEYLVNNVDAQRIVDTMNNLDTKARERSKALSKLEKENEQLKQQVEDLEFKLRTIKAYDRTAKEEHSDTVYDFKKKLEKW